MRQNTGSLPDGGLARHPLEENPAPCLPPPKADLPSHATWTGQDSTQASAIAGQVMVGTLVSRASRDPRQPRQTHRGHRWGQIPLPPATGGAGHSAPSGWHSHTAATHLDSEAGQRRKAPARDSHPTRQSAADAGAPSLGNRLGSQTRTTYLWLSPRTLLLGCHRSDLPTYCLSAPIRAEGGYHEMFRSHLSYGAVGQNAG